MQTNLYNIKMIGLDLDGTLLTDEKQIHPDTASAIQAAAEKGVIVLPATGRPLSGIPPQVLALAGIRYALTENGARIFDLSTNQVVHTALMQLTSAVAVLDILETYPCYVEMFWDNYAYATREKYEQRLQSLSPTDWMYQYVKSSRIPVPDLRAHLNSAPNGPSKINVIFTQAEVRQAARTALCLRSDIAVTSSMGMNLEINDCAADKGSGLLALGKLLNIDKNSIMACGDSDNDAAMLQKVGLGVAMGNADNSLKQIANYVTRTNNCDGVGHAIRKFVLN